MTKEQTEEENEFDLFKSKTGLEISKFALVDVDVFTGGY